LPADLGFYDLRLPEVRQSQADLARQYGIYGFCYYHYWFNGKRLLERPFNEVLASGKPDLPFCLCWANENWTRAWDGGSEEILIAQNYCQEDDHDHIKTLMPIFKDRRYIRVNGKALFLVYRSELLPDVAHTAEIWRDGARDAGVGDLYLVRVEGFHNRIDPSSIGFDAAVEFAPDWRCIMKWTFTKKLLSRLAKVRLVSRFHANNWLYSYAELMQEMLRKPEPGYTWFRCVTPGFDNSPRRKKGAVVLQGTTPAIYESWLRAVVQWTLDRREGDERLVFVNAWNEWGEGNYLEPCQRWGREYLSAIARALGIS
jgi:lipopolysaccharide biosynthesis protein